MSLTLNHHARMEANGMIKKKEDRRLQRTRQSLRDALFDLMMENRYDRITIQDIIDRANVGRSTFYAHFQDKEELATYSLEWIFEQMTQDMLHSSAPNQQLVPTLNLFQHVQEQQATFRALARGRGLALFIEKGQVYWNKQIEVQLSALVPKGKKPTMSLVLLSNYVTSTLVTLLKWWLDNKMPYSPERMDEIFHQLVMPGVGAALGVEHK
jgi:AcrR family transcriptional regulator